MAIIGQDGGVEAPAFSTRLVSKAIRQKFLLAGLFLTSRYDVKTTGGTGAGAPGVEAAFDHFGLIKVGYNGTDKITVHGAALGFISEMLGLGVIGEGTLTQVPPTDDAAGTEADRLSRVFLPFTMPRSFTPYQAALPTYDVDGPTLGVQIAPARSLFIGPDATAFEYQNGALQVEEVPIFGAPLRGQNCARGTSLYGELRIQTYQSPVTQTQDAFRITLENLKGHELRALFIQAYEGGSGGYDYVRSDALVEELEFVANGRTVLNRVAWESMQERNRAAYNRSSVRSGGIVFDTAEDKRTGAPADMLPIGGLEDPYLSMRTSKQAGDCFIRVTAVSFVRPSGR